MAKYKEGQRFPVIWVSEGEIKGMTNYAEVIEKKKRGVNQVYNRTTAELGEVAVDFLLEVNNQPRVWMRGPFHYDFASKKGDVRLEVKTRKYYYPDIPFDKLDVRFDYREYENAVEATHLVPLVYNQLSSGADIITPGVFELNEFISGCGKYSRLVPPDTSLKEPCFRTTWGLVFKSPDHYGFKPWKEFLRFFK